MYLLYKIATDVSEKEVAQEGDVSYVSTDNSNMGTRFGPLSTEIEFSSNKDNAQDFERERAKELAEKYGLEMEGFLYKKLGEGEDK